MMDCLMDQGDGSRRWYGCDMGKEEQGQDQATGKREKVLYITSLKYPAARQTRFLRRLWVNRGESAYTMEQETARSCQKALDATPAGKTGWADWVA